MGRSIGEASPEVIRKICGIVRELSGIALDDSKAYLIRHRVEPLLEQFDLDDYDEFATQLSRMSNRVMRQALIDAMTTNETSFFRDVTPFDALAYRILPDIVDGRAGGAMAKRLRFWSAAASTGQEAYSIAIRLHEVLPDISAWDIRIQGTDISQAAVDKATAGEYSDIEVRRGVDAKLLEKHFERKGSSWVAKPHLRKMVKFQQRNLLEPLTGLGPFDVVFCRNVGIYFEREVRDDLFNRVDQVVLPNGYVFLSNSEFLDTICPHYEHQMHCGSIYYHKPSGSSQG